MTERKRIWGLIDSAATWTLANPAWQTATDEERGHVIDKIQRHARDEHEAGELFAMITGHPYPGSETQP